MVTLARLALQAALGLGLLVLAGTPHASAAVDLLAPEEAPADSAFPLVVHRRAAVLCVAPSEPAVVLLAVRDLATDVERITGVLPEITEHPPADARPFVHIVTDPGLAGRWEAFQLAAEAGTQTRLKIIGSDPRGVAFGVYELSRRLGVSPWHWWADVPVARRPDLRLSVGTEPIDQPAVKYRGIFLNDEDWGLVPWAAETFESEVGNLGPKTYGKLFELMLRLRANTLWPGMHPTTTPFHHVPGNAAVADRYAIILGSSHAEPMLRNNVGEWTAPKDDYNYVTNRSGVLGYWEQRVCDRRSGESLFTLGMRGIHDSPIIGPKTRPERIATLEKIFTDQRELLARHLGAGDPARVPQIFVPYKEVLEDYDAGLRVPPDVTLVWPDDNFGYIRRFATPVERTRPGGLGIYYHLSYLGAPLPWLWFDSLPPALVWTELTRAYEQGARTLWIANVGDLKNTERSTEFFLDLAWHADRTSPAAPAAHLRAVAARDFGAAHAATIADLWTRHQALAFARKPEHLSWQLPKGAYQPTPLTDAEIHTRLAAYATLLRETEAAATIIPADAEDAFFELVGYPIGCAAFANQRYFQSELARRLKNRGDEPAARDAFAESESAARQITALTRRYNEDTAGGKWHGIVQINGLSPREWPSFQLPPILPLDNPEALATVAAQECARPPAPPPSPFAPPSDARPGDFFEREGVVSIESGHFTACSDAPEASGGWRSIPGLGRTGAAVTVLPSTLPFTAETAPRLSYRFHVTSGGTATARVRLLPTHPLISNRGLRIALALDNGAPLTLNITSGFDSKSDAWKQRILANATEAALTFPGPFAPGWHTLHLIAVDAGVVVDKIVLDLGGIRASYDGPLETRVH
jgi:hypothetical protein